MTATTTERPLTAVDRCDRCAAQAYVRTTLPSGLELTFCAHHWHENEDALREVAVVIHDESRRLAPVPTKACVDER